MGETPRLSKLEDDGEIEWTMQFADTQVVIGSTPSDDAPIIALTTGGKLIEIDADDGSVITSL